MKVKDLAVGSHPGVIVLPRKGMPKKEISNSVGVVEMLQQKYLLAHDCYVIKSYGEGTVVLNTDFE